MPGSQWADPPLIPAERERCTQEAFWRPLPLSVQYASPHGQCLRSPVSEPATGRRAEVAGVG